MQRTIIILGVLVALILVIGIILQGGRAPTEDEGSELRVVTSFLPLWVFAANVGGDAAIVENLLPQGAGVHDFAATPGIVQTLNNADLFVVNGLKLEGFLNDLLASVENDDLVIVDTSNGIESRKPPPSILLNGSAEPEAEGPSDPHIWLDPVRAMRQVGNIRDAFIAADPEHGDTYRANAEAFLNRLSALDEEIRNMVGTFSRKEFVAFHSSFSYFAERYGLTQVAVIEPFPGRSPTPQFLANLSALIREKGIPVIFTEPQFSPQIATSLARDLGITTLPLDPLETGVFAVDTYEKVMRENLKNLRQALE